MTAAALLPPRRTAATAAAILLVLVVLVVHLPGVEHLVLLRVGRVTEHRAEDPRPRARPIPHPARHLRVGLDAAAGLAATAGVAATSAAAGNSDTHRHNTAATVKQHQTRTHTGHMKTDTRRLQRQSPLPSAHTNGPPKSVPQTRGR